MITLYTTHCPKCSVLKKKLDAKNIIYTEVDDTSEMASLGLKTAPALEVDGKILDFKKAIDWVNKGRDEN